MSILLRSLPITSTRSKRLFPLLYLTSLTLTKPPNTTHPVTTTTTNYASASASPTPFTPTEKFLSSNPNQLPETPFEVWVSRTGLCGELSKSDVGIRVRLCGWVALHRVHGGLTFLNLRDHTGLVQVTTLPDVFPDAHSVVNDLRLEYVIAVESVVRFRPNESVNKKMKTGMIESMYKY